MNESVLIVDDEAPVRHMLRSLLEGRGYTVVEAGSGDAGLEAGSLNPVALVITDLKMPGMDGLTLAKKLLEQDPDRPVLLMTAYADLDSARRAVGVGIYEYFTKPFDVNDVVAGVRRALEHRRLVLEIRAHQQDLEQKVKERTAELQQAYGKLIQTERLSAVGRLASGVVDDVLNPLAVVIGRIDMVLANGAFSGPDRESLQVAREQADRAVRTLDTMRDFSQQRPQERVMVDLNALMTRTLALVAHETGQRRIEVVRRPGDLPGIWADQDQMTQVFLNLINNAIDAMPDGGRLTVETRAASDGREPAVEVRVRDTGQGIADADLPRIFEPFFTTREARTGLGLPISQAIVGIHGGRIEVERHNGKGTSFTVRLPVEGGEAGWTPAGG